MACLTTLVLLDALNPSIKLKILPLVLTADAETWSGPREDTGHALSTLKTSSSGSRALQHRVGEHKPQSWRKKNAHQCLYCPYTCFNRWNLIQHIRTHTGEKPFKCIMCSYASTRQHPLKVHMRRHTGEKPYACSMCSSAFQWKHQLKKHVEEQH